MKIIERYEKDGNLIEANSLLTTDNSVIDIRQIFILNDITYVSFDRPHEKILITEPADIFIQKNREYLTTLTPKAYEDNATGCKCVNCK